MRAAALAMAVSLGIACQSCGLSATRLLAKSPDYELYRQTRVAPTLEQRLRAAWQYLQRYPTGAFRSEVQTWFKRTEADYYNYAHPSRVRLRRYLEALPDGPHAAEARARVVALQRAARADELRDARVIERVRKVNDRLQRAEDARKEFVATVSTWVERLVSIEAWGRYSDEFDQRFLHTYLTGVPAPTCDDNECVKQITMTYAIPESRKLSARVAVFDVVLTLVNGLVAQAEVTGPDLFSRLGEALQRSPVSPEDPQARAEAIGVSRQLLAGVLEAYMPAKTCEQEVVSPVVLARACDGLEVRMIAALEVGAEDRVVVAPASPRDHEVPGAERPASSPSPAR